MTLYPWLFLDQPRRGVTGGSALREEAGQGRGGPRGTRGQHRLLCCLHLRHEVREVRREEEECFIIILSPLSSISYQISKHGVAAVTRSFGSQDSVSKTGVKVGSLKNSAPPSPLEIYHFVDAARWPVSLVLTHQNNRLSNREGDGRQRSGAGDGSRTQSRRGLSAGRHRSEVNVITRYMS